MAKKTFYPVSITPECNIPNDKLNYERTAGCAVKKHMQPLSRETTWDNLGKENDTVIAWGDVRPSKAHNSPSLPDFYNMVTTPSGSYNIPTPFTIDGWKLLDGNINDIPNSAKIKSIDVKYAWDQVTIFGTHMTLLKKGDYGAYRGGGGVFEAPTFLLNIGGYKKTVKGTKPRSISKCAKKNKTSYTTSELGGEHTVSFSGVSNLTMKQFKNSKLTFSPAKNTYDDFARIVMRHLKVVVVYEDTPATFNLKSLNVNPNSITNCPNDTSKVTIELNNTSVTSDTTEVTISGSGIKNATISNINKKSNDTFTKDSSGNRIWKVNDKCKSRTLSFNVSYTQPGNYQIKAKIKKNTGNTTEKETSIQVNSCKPVFDFELLDVNKNKNNRLEYSTRDSESNNTVYFRLTLKKSQILNHNESLQIDTDGLIFDDSAWVISADGNTNNNITNNKKDTIYTFSNIKNYTTITITGKVIFTESGLYNVTGKYINTSESSCQGQKQYKIRVKGATLPKDYFKLRVEDGSDIKYNSLMVSKGDDLLIPLTYTTEEIDKYVSNMEIYGETKRIPVNETQYIHFTINLNTEEKVELKNVLTYIDIYSKDYNTDDIIVGTGQNVKLLETDESYICSIDSISSEKPTIVKFAVNSPIEIDDIVIKIKPYNFDGYTDEIGWIPCHVMFKDIPNIKISIEGVSDLSYCEKEPNNKDIFWLYYKIQNLSDIDAEKVRFQLKEPHQFKKLCYIFEQENDCDDIYGDNSNAWFNKNNRIVTFEKLEANSAEHILAIQYQATKRGIYDFTINTLDSPDTLIDDQNENSYTHNVMVNIPSDVHITTSVSKTLPRTNELIDFTIKITNLYKKQKTFTFDIFDIGSYDIEHTTNDYEIEKNNNKSLARYTYGTFTESNDQNKIGTWTLTDIDVNKEYYLTLPIRPKDIGNHIIKTIFTNQVETICEDDSNIVKDFYNEVKVIEPDKQLEFNVYHAVSDDNIPCNDCNELTKICDDDFINLGDNIYYVFEIKNNSRNKINNALHIYARLPKTFLTNGILCSSRNYLLNQENNLISFTIPELQGCQHEDSIIKFCIKVQPAEIGKFISNFSLSTRNSSVLYKQLNLTVDTEFNDRQLEHEIKIYNFDKTNKYYRYEMDNIGNIFKFFNTGDKTLRPIQSEAFSKKSIETYKGTNLREIVEKIKEKSKYVDPLLLRTGSNKLADRGYELFPDGLIRRFGLLNSEIYHYSNQFPITKDLVDKAMKWDIDTWDTKLWAGDIYDNGVFSLAVDYTKVPANFNILDVDNPIKNLQNLVDNTKPYGTKAICHYAATVRANIQIGVDRVVNKIKHDIDVNLYLPEDFTLISYYNRFDDSIEARYDLMKYKLKIEIETLKNKVNAKENTDDTISSHANAVYTHIFADKIKKVKTEDCYDLISDTYNINTQAKNIDITKPFATNYDNTLNTSLYNAQIITANNTLEDKDIFGFVIKPYHDTSIDTHDDIDDRNNITNNTIYCVYTRNDIDDFTGFKFIINDTVVQERNINQNVKKFAIQVQSCIENDSNILHFWGSINGQEYYHIGLCILNDFKQPSCNIYNTNNYEYNRYSIAKEKDANISFKISDKVKTLHKKHNIIKAIERDNKWQYLNNIDKENKYTYFENKINIDSKCPEYQEHKINVPKIVLKYNDIDIDDLDEIIDIQFKIDMQTNKDLTNTSDGININLYKDGDSYIPEDKTSRKIHYPSLVTNINQEFLANMEIEQDNITICSQCLKTSLGYHDSCPYCGSPYVQHTNEKMPATACYSCDWITKGWHDYCPHCLSYDIEKIQIDYNKTYCQKCGTLSDDYYEHCPQCFANNSHLVHLTNNVHRYSIFGDDKQNIEPIIIQNVDAKTLDIFSLYAPFNHNTTEIKELSYLTLKIHGTNHNNGQYYYCEACNSGGVGNYETCPYCGSNLIHNESVSAYAIEPYYHACDFNVGYRDIEMIKKGCRIEQKHTPIVFNSSIPVGNFIKEIDLIKCAEHNFTDKFKLTFTLENQQYEQIANTISQLPIKDEYQAEILESISLIDISIDNLSLDYKYKNEREWINLDKLEHDDHTGVSYYTSPYNTVSDSISFKNFNIEKGQYKKASLYITGFLKNIPNDVVMHVKVVNNNTVNTFDKVISDTLFIYNNDILKEVDEYVKDVSVEISFSGINDIGEIIITDCNILTEKTQYNDLIHDDINKISAEYIEENNTYLFKSINNNLWGLKDVQPYYLSGRQLKTNLIAYIDFGKLNLEEYIRLYDIEMIIYYKAKNGNIVTNTISSLEENETFKKILMGVGYTTSQIDTIISNGTSLEAALEAKQKHIDSSDIEQLLSGEINSINSELVGEITYSNDVVSLNNLESKVTNINENDELVNDIPLYYRIAQSFNTDEYITNIDTLYIDYSGKKGYPNDTINVYLYTDNNNQPGNIIASNKVQTNNVGEVLNIDFDIHNLQPHTQYWIVLEDISADNNNYHRFHYNDNLSIGQLLTYHKNYYNYESCALSFGIATSKRDKIFYDLPTTWIFDSDNFDGYKIHYTLYRYNIEHNSNTSLSNFVIKSGYSLGDFEHSGG